jgi:hypothetical protein
MPLREAVISSEMPQQGGWHQTPNKSLGLSNGIINAVNVNVSLGGMGKAGSNVQVITLLNGIQICQQSQQLMSDSPLIQMVLHPTYYGNPYPYPSGSSLAVKIIYSSQVVNWGLASAVAQFDTTT